ncbi:MAG: PhoH family protein [Bacilli bacterium]|nr:PhoH family protein [Bacilli bacterium]
MPQASSSYQLFGVDFGSNPGQRELIRQINEDCTRKPVVFCKGSAGTGKTFAALAASLALVRGKGAKKKYKTVYYVREPVEIGHRLGYLKGTEEDKLAPYLGPLLDNYNHLMAKARSEMKVSEVVKTSRRKKSFEDDEDMMPKAYQHLPNDIIPLAPEFMRGRSFENCIIIVDEAQNMTIDEIQTLVTRIGPFTKMVIIGSPNQIDVPGQTEDNNAFDESYKILEPTGLVGFIELVEPMRSSFVADFDMRFVEYKKKLAKEKALRAAARQEALGLAPSIKESE